MTCPECGATEAPCPGVVRPVTTCHWFKQWVLKLTCCGRDNGTYATETWDEADQFRESYTSGVGVDPHGYSGSGFEGHQRSAVIQRGEV